jgi:hypothetical protein
MPEAAQIGLFIHIVAVFGLGSASGISVAVFTMMQRAKTVQELRVWGSLGALLSKYYVFPALGLLLLLSGAYLVDKVGEEWSEGWIGISAVALIAAVAAGFFVNTPRLKAIGMAAGPAPDGPVPASITEQLNDPVLVAVSRALPLTAVAIAWNMTVHPGMAGALLSIVILAGIGAASAYLPAQQQT